jgi:hypothetical protein
LKLNNCSISVSNSRFDQKGLENEGNGIFVKKLYGKTGQA